MVVGAVLLVLTSQATAQTSLVLKTFDTADGVNPEGGLVCDGATLYGTAYAGGDSNRGVVFKVNTDGTGFTKLHSFGSTNAYNPRGTLIVSDGVLYGTTRAGGSNSRGVVFRITTNGTGYAVLKNCNVSDGSEPYGGLVLQSNVLYGTTFLGGSGGGVVFRVATNGTGYAVLRHLNPTTDGSGPMTSLVCANNVLYGTAVLGGMSNKGTVFKVNTDGTDFTVLHHFDGATGDNPEGAMVLNGDTLYGTTYDGGEYGFFGTVFKVNIDGTGFAVLKSFDYSNDDAFPIGRLVLVGGQLFGATIKTVFKINLDGSNFALLKPFGEDGNTPTDSVVQDGVFYTSLRNGGHTGYGVVWKCDLRTPLVIQRISNQAILIWTNAAFGLQSAAEPTGNYTNVPNATSPFTNQTTQPARFFRLQLNLHAP